MSLRPSLCALLLLACNLQPYDAAATTPSTSDTSTTTTSSTPTTATPGAPTTTSTASDPTSTTSDATTCTFICGPDSPDSGCDLWREDCPEGQKCMPYANDGGSAWNALKCSPLDPTPDMVDEPCTVEGNYVSGVDSCEKHAICWNIDPQTSMGTCMAMCVGGPDEVYCEDPDAFCTFGGDGVLFVCIPECDPIVQDCGTGELCIPFPWLYGDKFICVPDFSGDEGQLFDPCNSDSDCDPGLYCADPAAAVECDPQAVGCCLPFCDLDDPNTCPGAGQQCLPWYDAPADAAPYNTDVGACALP